MIMTARAGGTPVATAIVNYFSFFTILTNLLVALVLTFSGRVQPTNFFCRPSVQSTAAVSIAIVGIVYSLVLRNLWDPEGMQKIADIILHDAIPMLYVLYWVLFVRKDDLKFSGVTSWLAYPGIYLVYTLIRGAITGRYPYHFLDAAQLGYPRVAINIVILLVAFLGVSCLLLAIGRCLQRSSTR
jgi:hypothetical protein